MTNMISLHCSITQLRHLDILPPQFHERSLELTVTVESQKTKVLKFPAPIFVALRHPAQTWGGFQHSNAGFPFRNQTAQTPLQHLHHGNHKSSFHFTDKFMIA
jgi:hypothetical protein